MARSSPLALTIMILCLLLTELIATFSGQAAAQSGRAYFSIACLADLTSVLMHEIQLRQRNISVFPLDRSCLMVGWKIR